MYFIDQEKYSILILSILVLQIGHLAFHVANFSLTEQSWQQQAWPQGKRTVLTAASKQILHSSLFRKISSSPKSTSGPVFSALEVEAALGRVGLAAAAPSADMELRLLRGVRELAIDWIIRPA